MIVPYDPFGREELASFTAMGWDNPYNPIQTSKQANIERVFFWCQKDKTE